MSSSEFVEEVASPGSGSEKGVDLEGDDWPRIETEGPCMLGEVCQEILGVEEAHHCYSSCDVHGIDVVPVNEGIEVRG